MYIYGHSSIIGNTMEYKIIFNGNDIVEMLAYRVQMHGLIRLGTSRDQSEYRHKSDVFIRGPKVDSFQ